MDKLSMILTKDELDRIKIIKNNSEICMDLHKLTAKQAKRLVSNLIALNRTSFSLRLIHGYNHGTAIKEMLWNKFDNDRLKERKTVENNPGQTIFMIKETA